MIEEEQRVLVFSNGDQGEVIVSRIAPGRFRIEDFFCFVFLSDNFPEDLPQDAGVGWVVEVDELEDGRLLVRQIVSDPNVESVNGFLIPPDFPQSPEFKNLSSAIISRGGRWEVVAKGLFSAYVPKGERTQFSLERDLWRALQNWIKRQGDPGLR